MTNEASIRRLKEQEKYDFADLCEVMRLLRSPDGCPWDGEQDHKSIRSSLIEETYEVIEAIDNDDPVLLREELGDLLFQIVFHSQIEMEKEVFCIDDVIHDITGKMIHRHPHVFGDLSVKSSGEVLSNWESIKTEEKQRNTLGDKLRAIPPMLPALMRASKVTKKAKLSGDLSTDALFDALASRIEELREADEGEVQERIGRLLMAVTQLSVHLGADAEYALFEETERIISQFSEKNT